MLNPKIPHHIQNSIWLTIDSLELTYSMYPTDSFGSMDISNPRDSSDRSGSSDPGVSLDQRNSSESIESTYSLGTSNPIKTSVGASNIGASLFYLITQRNGHQLSIISDIIYWNSDPKELFHMIRMVSN